MSQRTPSDAARLARLGFSAPEAGLHLAALPFDPALIAEAADPDQALRFLYELKDLIALSKLSPDEAIRLIALLGASSSLAEHLLRYPDDLRFVTRTQIDEPITLPDLEWEPALMALRRQYRQRLLTIASNDLVGEWNFPQVSRTLAQLADQVLQQALLVAQHSHQVEAKQVKLAVIAMGKSGGLELNYISDVDVIFVGEPVSVSAEEAMRGAALVASTLMRACSEMTADGSIWPVDAALRPEGKDGPLVRTIESHAEYYRKWAKTWEFQALLKARYAAGDSEVASAYLSAVQPLVWSAADREDFVVDVQAMRKRVEESVPAKEVGRQIKLGVGGLRDVEFAVQLLQLVHGKADASLRTGNTLAALAALSAGGFVGREDAAHLSEAYSWLRTLEHRIQISRLRRSHVIPTADDQLRALGRGMGYKVDPLETLHSQWRERASLIRRIHEKLFYSPLLMAVAKLGAEEQRLTPEAAQRRLLALGYLDPQGALVHLEALTAGLQRRATIQKALLPAMLGWFADGPDPDAGLFGFRNLSESLGDTPWYLRTLRDSGVAAQRLARILSTSRYATELLMRAPEAAAMFEDDEQLRPRGRDALVQEARAVVSRYDEPVAAMEAVRAVRRRELFRTAVADVLGLINVEEVGVALTDVAAATLWAAYDAASRTQPLIPTRLSVIAMGRLGGAEMSYPSDADVLFVHEPISGADEKEATDAAMRIAALMREICALPSPEPPLLIDADLRPEGRDGPLVRTLDSYQAYYSQWSQVWEQQALLRALPLSGDEALGERFIEMINPYRFPSAGLSAADVREIRRIKARVESERLPRGADPARHVKLGPGGLSDIEWVAQLLQLKHASLHPELRSPSTLGVLREAARLQLISDADLHPLIDAWKFASRIRNGIMLVRGKPGDELPRDPRDLRAVSHLLNYESGTELIAEWQRASRRARLSFERLFFAD